MWAHVPLPQAKAVNELTDFAMDKSIMKVCVFGRDVILCFASLSFVVHLFRDCVELLNPQSWTCMNPYSIFLAAKTS